MKKRSNVLHMTFSVGFDAASFRQQTITKGKPHITRGLIGVGVKTDDVDAFNKAYKRSISTIFKKFQVKQEKQAYCAAELSAILGAQSIDKEKDALELFLKEIKPTLNEVHLFYTFLFHIKTITIFGDDPDGHQYVPVLSYEKGKTDFYDLIEPAYPMLCAWKYGREHEKDTLLLDNFQERVCPAWNEFSQTNKFNAYYNGDRCNALISTADLITRLVKLRMLAQKTHFLESQMNSLLPEIDKKFYKHFLGVYYLKKMTPHKRTRIDSRRFIKHPITFVLRETPKDQEERQMIESTPSFARVLDNALQNNGCVKFFDKQSDTRILEKQDTLFTIGENGEKIAKHLKKLGKEFEHVTH